MLTVRTRIVLAMTLVLAVNVAAAAFSTREHAQANASTTLARAADERARHIADASRTVTEFAGAAAQLGVSLATESPSAELSAEYGAVIGAERTAAAAIARLQHALPQSDAADARSGFDDVRAATYHWINTESRLGGKTLCITETNKGFQASNSTNLAPPARFEGLEGSALRTELRSEQRHFTDAFLRRLVRDAEDTALVASANAADARQRAVRGTALLVLVGVLVAAAAAVWLYGSIARPLAIAEEFANAVSGGDLGARLELRGHAQDEIGVLAHAIEEMRDAVVARIDNLRELAGLVMVTSEDIARSADEAVVLTDPATSSSGLRFAVKNVREGVVRLGALVGHMLDG